MHMDPWDAYGPMGCIWAPWGGQSVATAVERDMWDSDDMLYPATVESKLRLFTAM